MDSILLPLSPVLVGVVRVFKEAGLPTRFLPALAVLLGVGLALFLKVPALDGVVVGLVSVGLFSGVRATVNK